MKMKNKVIEFKFDGVFDTSDIEIVNLSLQHINLIQMLDSKKQISFNLNYNEAIKIFNINKNWTILKCKVNLHNDIINTDNSKYKIEIELMNNNDNKCKYNLRRILMKQNYKFLYKDNFYLCFTVDSLRQKFDALKEEHEFYIEANNNNKKLIIQPASFFNTHIIYFEIKINYKFIDIDLEKVEFNNIYKQNEQSENIHGNELNEKLGLYTQLTKNDFNDFKYYQTNERKQFLSNLIDICDNNNTYNNIGICGPFGTGKTITLLKFLIESNSYRTFYINLYVITHTSIEHLKNLFKYESIKLFGGNIFKKDNEFCSNKDRLIYLEIVNEIDKFNDKKEIFSLLGNIIKCLNLLEDKKATYIIIDQYSSKYDDKNNNLNNLFYMKKDYTIHIIVSSSMNNYDIKQHFSISLNLHKILLSESKGKFDLRFNYYYVGCLIRLNQLEDYNDLLKDKSRDFKNYLNELGNIPLFYYELKDAMSIFRTLSGYMEEEKDKIIREIDLFYKNNNETDNIKKILDIFKILSNINEKRIYFFEELSNEVIKLPLKFIEIKKEEIKLKDLKIFAFASDNKELFQKLDMMDETKIDKLLENENISSNYIKCINNDNYCSKYIEKISEKKRKKIIGKKGFNDSKITVYYLDYLFPYMKEIFSDLIYNVLINTSKFIYRSLPPQSQGGLLEYIINSFVKNNKEFMDIQIGSFEKVENFVPNNFFIQNYSSRKTETLKTYIETKNIYSDKKEELNISPIFIEQIQFTGKYYDFGLLIYKNETNSYILYLFQVSKKKIASNRYYREEHKIIFNGVTPIIIFFNWF